MSEFLRAYFSVPSKEGFSAYRAGEFVHILFSALVGTVVLRFLIPNIFPHMGLFYAYLIAFLSIVSVWGIGVLIGVYSHYNGFITLAVIAAWVGLIIVIKWPVLVFFWMTGVFHLIAYYLLKALGRIWQKKIANA